MPIGVSALVGGISSSEVDDMNKSVRELCSCSTKSAASFPPAPGLLRMTVGVPVIPSNDSAMNRAAVEEVPPAANPTTSVRCSLAPAPCAAPLNAKAMQASIARTKRRLTDKFSRIGTLEPFRLVHERYLSVKLHGRCL